MDRNTPKLPVNMKSAATMKNSPRKSSYTVGFPPNLPAALHDKNARSVQEKSEVLAQHSLSTISSNSMVVNNEFKNGNRSDVVALEAWTHKQLAEIHFKHSDDPASAHREKERESADQVKVLDASAELLAKMVEVHCIDKARLMRKLWSSSADLFNSIYTELSSIIHELKLKLSDKTMVCNRLEETMNRVRTAATSGGTLSALATHDRDSLLHNATEPPLPFVDTQTATVRALEEELLLKNQEMMQLQATLTSLAIWFPNFAKFNASILSKYLPPIDYLEELERIEREREAEEKRLLQLKQEEEARFAVQMSQKHSPSGKHRPTLNAIGESKKVDGDHRKHDANHPKKADNRNEIEKEMQEVEIAQNYLLKDLKRLQGLGVGFAVLDPVELEAAKAAVSRNYLIAQSAGMFVNNNNPGKSPTANSTGVDSGTVKAAMSAHGNAASATAVPKSFASAVGRTSIALTNQFKHRLVTMKSFVEVQGDEYSLAPVGDTMSQKVTPVQANEDTNKVVSNTIDQPTVSTKVNSSLKHTPSSPKVRNATSSNNSMGAAAAAALQNVLQDETTTPLQIGDASPTITVTKKNTNNKDTKDTKDTTRGDMNTTDFYKLQNVRVSKIDADVAAAMVQRLARSISAKSKGLLAPTAPKIEMDVPTSLAQDSNNPDANEYELKYRNLLIDAQKLEVARAKAEKKMKDDAKAHHKQLLRMSAHVTTLQNKLQASHNSANLMLQKIPHVVFSPMIGREYNNNNIGYGTGDFERRHNNHSDYQYPSVKSNISRGAEHTNTHQNTESANLNTLHSIFDSAFSDINVLLNNSRAPRRGDYQHSSAGADDEGTDFVNRGSTSPPRSRGPSAPTQQNGPTPARTLTISEIHHLVTRFCAHFVQSSPTAVSNNTADGTHLNGGSGLRDDLYVQFGQGPDQYKFGYLSAVLNGQSVSLFNVDSVVTAGSGSGDNSVHRNAYKSAQYLEDSSISAGYVQPMEYGASVDTHSRQPSVTFADELPSVVNNSILDSSSIVYGEQVQQVQKQVVHQPNSVFAVHLFQYLASNRPKSTNRTTNSTALLHAILTTLLHQRELLYAHNTHISRPTTGPNRSVSSNAPFVSTFIERTFPQEGLVKCLLELFGLALSTPLYYIIPSTTSTTPHSLYAYLEHLNNGDARQHKLRQSIFFDVFMTGFQAMQRYLTITSTETNTDATTSSVQPHSFPLTATERILRRMFTIVGEDTTNSNSNVKRRNTNNANHTNATVVSSISCNTAGAGSNNNMKSNTTGVSHHADSTAPAADSSGGHSGSGGHQSQAKYEREAQSPPWWRTLTHSAFATLIHDVRMIAVTEHRARALSEMLGVTSISGIVHHQEKSDSDPVELRVDCYECILTCMNNVYAQHHRLMLVLMNMYRFLESLSIQHGVANRTYHLLLAHFLQSAYPSVQDVNNAFNISSVAQGTFSFAPRTAIVVNLELMCELQALQGRGVLNKYTFADAVLRSVPNYLVQGLCPLLEPASAVGAAHRAKLISDGTMHLTTLQEMLQRSYQHLQNEAVSAAAEIASNQSSKSHKRSTVVNEFTGAVSPSKGDNHNAAVGKRSPRTDPDLKAQPSHFKQNYLLNKLLFPEETHVSSTSTESPRTRDEPSEEEFLLQEMLDCESLFHTADITNAKLGSPSKVRNFTVSVNPFIQKLLLHCKLSYDVEVTGVLATSIAEVTFTTWTMQYVVETLSRLRGSSMRLKTLFKKDMKQYTYTSSTTENTITSTDSANPASPMSPSIAGAKHMTSPRKASTVNVNANIGSIGDYVLVDILLGDVDLDLFVRVEAHYIRALQKKVFRAWSAAVEDIFED